MAGIGSATLGKIIFSEDPSTTEPNPSIELGYNAAGQLVRIRKTENDVTKTQLITGDSITDTVVATTKTYSAWS